MFEEEKLSNMMFDITQVINNLSLQDIRGSYAKNIEISEKDECQLIGYNFIRKNCAIGGEQGTDVIETKEKLLCVGCLHGESTNFPEFITSLQKRDQKKSVTIREITSVGENPGKTRDQVVIVFKEVQGVFIRTSIRLGGIFLCYIGFTANKVTTTYQLVQGAGHQKYKYDSRMQ